MKKFICRFRTLCLLLAISACKDLPENRVLTPSELSGTWSQTFAPGECAYGCTAHLFQFDADGHFRLLINRSSDAIDIDSPCPANRTSFVAGTWSVDGFEITLHGLYTASDFSTPAPDCAEGADFAVHSGYTYIDGAFVLLDYPRANQPLQLRK